MRIGCVGGRVRKGTLPPPATNTPVSANSGQIFVSGVDSATLPSSTSIMKAMLVIGLVMLAMRKIASSFSAAPGRASPMHERCAISPRRDTRVAACGKRPGPTYLASRKAGMRLSRAVSKP